MQAAKEQNREKFLVCGFLLIVTKEGMVIDLKIWRTISHLVMTSVQRLCKKHANVQRITKSSNKRREKTLAITKMEFPLCKQDMATGTTTMM